MARRKDVTTIALPFNTFVPPTPAMPEPKTIDGELCAYCEEPLDGSRYSLSWRAGVPEAKLCKKCGQSYHPTFDEVRKRMEERERR